MIDENEVEIIFKLKGSDKEIKVTAKHNPEGPEDVEANIDFGPEGAVAHHGMHVAHFNSYMEAMGVPPEAPGPEDREEVPRG